MEVPNLKEQAERRRDKNLDIQEWRLQAYGDRDTRGDVTDEDQSIPPVDDTASIHENKVIEDQVYYKTSTALTEADQLLMLQPRHWADPL
jgi:hypothetical protein